MHERDLATLSALSRVYGLGFILGVFAVQPMACAGVCVCVCVCVCASIALLSSYHSNAVQSRAGGPSDVGGAFKQFFVANVSRGFLSSLLP